jgi:hypothetical protein
MKIIQIVFLKLRRAVCSVFGHVEQDVSIATVGFTICRRCLRITEQRTVRKRVTKGDIERRMEAYPPTGYRFINCNWQKRKANNSETSTLR